MLWISCQQIRWHEGNAKPRYSAIANGTHTMLRNWRDSQVIVYLLAQPALIAWLWIYGFSWPLYVTVLFLTVAVNVIHHNHAHLKMWNNNGMNKATDFYLTLLQGHPTFVFHVSHNSNHHRYRNGMHDLTRTSRFGGDTNNLLGYLLHPFQAVWVLYPAFWTWLQRLRMRRPSVFKYCLLQYLAVGLLWISLAVLDWKKWGLFVLLPQAHGFHWLLASNYLQHAHTDGESPTNFARNFEGLVNLLLFNVGLHTAHHFHGNAHWTELPALHSRYRSQIDPRLNAKGLLPYMLTTYVLSLLWSRFRSQPLMTSDANSTNPALVQ